MEITAQNTTEKLNHLIAIAEDGKEGYENAAEEVKDPVLKNSFLLFSQERSVYASELREMVHQLNGEAEDTGGDSIGSLHRTWMDVKSIFTSGGTESIVNVCITGEEAAVKEYKLALNDPLVPESCKPIIGKQLNGIEKALTSIKSHVHK